MGGLRAAGRHVIGHERQWAGQFQGRREEGSGWRRELPDRFARPGVPVFLAFSFFLIIPCLPQSEGMARQRPDRKSNLWRLTRGKGSGAIDK